MTKPGFNICVGPDPILLKDYIDEQIRAWPPGPGQAWERHTFWGEEPLPADFWEKLTLQGLFQRPKVIILRKANELTADTLKKISAALGRADAQTWPFICFENEFEKGRAKIAAHILKLKFLTFAKDKKWYREIPPLMRDAKRSFVQKEAASLGLRLAPAELENLLPALPQDAGAIRLELSKVSLAADAEGKLTPEALDMLNFEPEMDIFAFLSALQNGQRPEMVWAQFSKGSDSSDAGLFSFLAMLLREGRILWQLLAGEPVFIPAQQQGNKMALARTLGYGGLSRIWDLALRAEKGIKTGERNPRQAFELLLADLFRLFNR